MEFFEGEGETGGGFDFLEMEGLAFGREIDGDGDAAFGKGGRFLGRGSCCGGGFGGFGRGR